MIDKDESADLLNSRYLKSVQVAATFCSPELMSYLDINLSSEPGQTFYDSRLVGVTLSRAPVAIAGADGTSRDIAPKGSLEIRVLGPMHDRVLSLFLSGVSWFSPNGVFLLDAPDIHWLEFKEEAKQRVLAIHFTSSSKTIDTHFMSATFRTHLFMPGESGTGDFKMPLGEAT